MRTFTTHDLMSASGATYRQLDSWIRLGRLTPSIAPGRGTGNPREFSSTDAAKAVAMTVLIRDMGVTPRIADLILTDHHRKTVCAAQFGPVKVTIDMRAVRRQVTEWVAGRELVEAS